MVLRKLGVIGSNTSVVSADADIVYEAIDLRLKEMHRQGIFWRKVDTVPATLTLSAGIASAHIATNDILFPIKMTVRDNSIDEACELIGKPEYAAIAVKTDQGIPYKAIWKGSTEFLFYPVPLAATTARLTYNKIADDTTAGSAADVEVSMMRWLKDIVAYDVADDFAVDEAKIQRLMKEASQAEKNIRKLAIERKDLKPVSVDDWSYTQTDTDYGA